VITSGAAATGYRRFGIQDVTLGATNFVDIVISSQGGVDLALGTPTLAGTNPQDYVLDLTGFQGTLAFGTTCVIRVAFDPISKGPKFASIEFTHNDTGLPMPFSISLEGVGSDPNGVVLLNAVMPAGAIGETYTPYALQISGGTAPYTVAQIGGNLPSGMTLDATGTLTGTPMGAHGVFMFRVLVTDALGGTEDRQCEISIAPPPGYTEKASGRASGGGCVAEAGATSWIAALLGLSVLVLRRNRRKA
jgi:MYXO-CTERM domain-containing protein